MTDEQKFQTMGKLCQDVLGGVADGHLPVEGSEDLLSDVFAILSSKV
jgi:hypothetical protein